MSRPHNQYLIYHNFPSVELSQKCVFLPKKTRKSMDGFINHIFDPKIPRMSETDNLYSMPSSVSRYNFMESERLSPCLPPCLLESEKMQYVQHWINEIQDESYWRDLSLESEAVQSSSSGSGNTNGDNNSITTGTGGYTGGCNGNAGPCLMLNGTSYGNNAQHPLTQSGAIVGSLYDFLDSQEQLQQCRKPGGLVDHLDFFVGRNNVRGHCLQPSQHHNFGSCADSRHFLSSYHHQQQQQQQQQQNHPHSNMPLSSLSHNHHHTIPLLNGRSGAPAATVAAAALMSSLAAVATTDSAVQLQQSFQHNQPTNHQLVASTRFTSQETELILQLFEDYFRLSICPGLAEVRARLTNTVGTGQLVNSSTVAAAALLAKRRTPQAVRAKIKRLQMQCCHQQSQQQSQHRHQDISKQLFTPNYLT